MKELVHGEMPYGNGGLDEKDWVPVRSVVDVRWNREGGYFQIATRAIDAVTGGEIHEYPPELRRMTPQPENPTPLEIAEAGEYEARTLAVWGGYFTTLDRAGINDLIKKLRRARDQTFGRDE